VGYTDLEVSLGRMRLQDRIALVTGGGRSIGREICLALAREGAVVVVADLDAQAAHETVFLIEEAGGQAMPVRVDVTNKPQVQEMVKRAVERFGRIDILVNNVGILAVVPVVDMPEETWDRVMTINTKGTFLCVQAVLPHMMKQRYGKIINMASQAGKEGSALTSAYAASKHAVIGFTESLAKEAGEYNITANAICPGSVDTEMLDREYFPLKAELSGQSVEDYTRAYVKRIPLQRLARLDEIASAVVFLASAEADYITGIGLNVAGGSMLR